MKEIYIKNGKLHNLKNIDLRIPKNKFIVFTGVSGSGKSTVAFDILFKEGCKGYLQSLGYGESISHNNGFDSIEGLGATIAVKQRTIRASNPRSVVGTKTGIYDYVKMLYFTEGTVKCKNCGGLTDKNLICKSCGEKAERVSSGSFSFNSPNGMCLRCMGRGYVSEVDLEKVIKDENLALKDICAYLPVTPQIKNDFKKFVKLYGVKEEESYASLKEEVKKAFLYGVKDKFWGVVPNLKWKMFKGRDIGDFGKNHVCPKCNGERLCEEGRSVVIREKSITQIGNMTIKELREFLKKCLESENFHPQGIRNLEFIASRLDNLINADLGHLTLYRPVPTLSGGEIQRLFLMEQLSLSMESLIYIFDEPTSGLHEIEKEKLLNKIMALKNHGNTVIVVEHDRNTIKRGEHIIDFGPMAGINGGNVVFQGSYEELLKCKASVTGRYLLGEEKIEERKSKLNYKGLRNKLRVIDQDQNNSRGTEFEFRDNIENNLRSIYDNKNNLIRKEFRIINANTNNLKGINTSIPLGLMVGIAGVSGSGKSSLIGKTLIPLLKNHFKDFNEDNDEEEDIGLESENDIVYMDIKETQLEGAEFINGFVEIGQNPIGRNSRSNVLTYLNIWERVRKIFADEAKDKGFTPGDFSFNSKGACEMCKGSGIIENSIGGLGTISIVCPECDGKRYREEIIKVKYREKSILDILNMSVSEGKEFFKDDEMISEMLRILENTGMGYITLGQPTPTISGGEAQRIKLAKELGKKNKTNILYILDEPTTGLSFYDTARLMPILDGLVSEGNSVVIIEHDPEVLSHCDWIIELGPGSADEGGLIIAEGTPMDLKNNPKSVSGEFLCKTH